MVSSNASRCVTLVSILLIYFSEATNFRQQELLYGRVHGDGAEYVFVARDEVPISDISTAHRLQLTRHDANFFGKVSCQVCGAQLEWTVLHTISFPLHNSWQSNHDVVTKARIYRLKDGETSEYIADVVKGDRCFDNIRQRKDSDDEEEYEAAPKNIERELHLICLGGFSALHPITDLTVLDGNYTGSRQGRDSWFDFNKGKVRDAKLTVKEIDTMHFNVIHYPLCDGVILAEVAGWMASIEKPPSYSLLRRSKVQRQQGWSFASRRRRRQRAAAPGDEGAGLLDDDDESNALCRAKHVRRRLSHDVLYNWDCHLPNDFMLKVRV
ncbi:hypothetical protein FOZ63_014013 [Perkinsus olseni]|uniref:Uncharacterized protein n=1 Tax=Perkinsus olseni TaxID=32597 RepID=A0A7J6UKF6_PEROL|nr:hypothetical protein FOZ62_030084 [Perkinsus olseni]KAF4757725.1 hypothetical protein FOZ63_014013 [Perkinsus olseni]